MSLTAVLLALAAAAGSADGGAALEVLKPAAVVPRPSAGCARSEIARGRRIEQTLDVGGLERRYILDVPETVRAGEPTPLLFDFHGIGHSGAGVWNVSGFKDLAPRAPFVTVYPDGEPVSFTRDGRSFAGAGWEIRALAPNRDVDFALAMLDRLERDYCIDRARVYATGFSNGGFFSHVLACTHPDRFAAVAPVSGGWLPWACAPARAVPVLIHHGRQDDVIDVAEARRAWDAWRRIDGCDGVDGVRQDEATPGTSCRRALRCRDGAMVEYCEGDFAHRWPAPATERIWGFFVEHPLPAAESTPGAP